MKAFIITFTLSLLSLYSCKPDGICPYGTWDDRLHIINNSSKPIYFINSATYPDTNIGNFKHTGIATIAPNSSNYNEVLCSWEKYFHDYVKSDTMIAYIVLDEGQGFLLQNLEKYPVLKRFDLTLKDLDSMNWTITYP